MGNAVLLLIAGVVVTVLVVSWLIRGRSTPIHPDALRAVLDANGARRCLAALRLFQELARRADEASIAQAWEALELPLLHAKAELVLALDACALACGNRELDKRIMTLRRGLYPDAP